MELISLYSLLPRDFERVIVMNNKFISPTRDRLDKVLVSILGESRSQVSKLIKIGAVKVNGKNISKSSNIVEEGDVVEYLLPKVKQSESKKIDFDVEILYEDDDILIINKPAGLVVHPAPSLNEATLVDWLINKGISLSTLAGEERHGIVHRIDRGTSGVLAIAKNNNAHRVLAEELKSKEMGRFYLAIIDKPLKNDITIDKPIARNPHNRLKMAIIENGREAKTDFIKISQAINSESELIGAKLYTGRTHQIRVHLSSIGRHILGDKVYGSKKALDDTRVFLHAYIMRLTHPVNGKQLIINAPIPNDMREYLNKNYRKEEINEANIQKRLFDTFDINIGDIK